MGLWCLSVHCWNVYNYGKYGNNLYFFSNFYYSFCLFFVKDKINLSRIIGLIVCLTGVLIIICKGDLSYLFGKFTTGDLWMLGAAIGWAVYSSFD